MQPVRLAVAEVTDVRIVCREESAYAIQVNDRNRPNVSRFFYCLYIIIDIQIQSVSKGFIGLDIVVSKASVRPMDRSEQDDLLFREVCFKIR